MAPAGRARIAFTVRLLGRMVRGLLAAFLLAVIVVGLPAALIHGVGWPLPEHLPTMDEVSAVLMAPMSTRFLLDTLACLGWLVWAAFVIDAAVCSFEVARGARWRDLRAQAGPVRRVAAVLVGALLVAVLGRTAIAAPAAPVDAARPAGHSPVVATAPAWPAPATGDRHSTQPAPPRLPGHAGAERVRPPENGVYDSLWRIAQRCLGDGGRWPEIWALNHGSTQPGGRVLTSPHRIHPGDILRLPGTSTLHHAHPAPPASPPQQPGHAPVDPAPAPEPTHPAPSTPAPSSSTPASPVADHEADSPGGGAVTWGSGEVFVSLGLAAAVSALLVLARRRWHARYRPGSGTRGDDLPAAPVVYQLHLAHLQARHHQEDRELEADSEQGDDEPTPPERCSDHARPDPVPRTNAGASGHTGSGCGLRVLEPRTRRVIGAPRFGTAATSPSVVDIALDTARDGDRATPSRSGEGTQVALDLARVHGIGLVGPGGYAAARALLLTVLTTVRHDRPAPEVLVPAADLVRLLGVPVPATDLPETITVVPDLDTALTILDSSSAAPRRPVVLISSPPQEPDQQARLQHLLDNDAQYGLTALLLGQWRPGVTALITARGLISATDPGLGEPLRGTRAFTLPETATRDLLTFLRATTVSEPTSEDHPGRDRESPGLLEITSSPAAPGLRPTEDAECAAEPRSVSRDTAALAEVSLTVLGAPALAWRPDPVQPDDVRDLSGGLSQRLVDLLTYLAVHPGGVSRDGVVDALWPHEPPRDPARALRLILFRIRRALETATSGAVSDLVLVEHGKYRLDPVIVEVDYWAFAEAVSLRRAATTPQRRADACEAIVASYTGPLGAGLDSHWLTAAREATRRDALDAVAVLARARVETDPDYTLDLLETARAFDPHNELLYRDIMRLQHVLGRHDAISRTLTLLQTRLAELDTAPDADTIDLAQRLRALHTGLTLEDIPRSSTT